jgi:hypothetical protein
VLEVELAMLDQEVADGQAEGASVVERLAKARTHAAEADSELQRLESEGPPNHRKRDPLDKVRAMRGARGREGDSNLGHWVLQGVCWVSRVSPSPRWGTWLYSLLILPRGTPWIGCGNHCFPLEVWWHETD